MKLSETKILNSSFQIFYNIVEVFMHSLIYVQYTITIMKTGVFFQNGVSSINIIPTCYCYLKRLERVHKVIKNPKDGVVSVVFITCLSVVDDDKLIYFIVIISEEIYECRSLPPKPFLRREKLPMTSLALSDSHWLKTTCSSSFFSSRSPCNLLGSPQSCL